PPRRHRRPVATRVPRRGARGVARLRARDHRPAVRVRLAPGGPAGRPLAHRRRAPGGVPGDDGAGRCTLRRQDHRRRGRGLRAGPGGAAVVDTPHRGRPGRTARSRDTDPGGLVGAGGALHRPRPGPRDHERRRHTDLHPLGAHRRRPRGGDRPEPGPAGPVDPRHPSFGVPAPRARPRRPAGLTGPTRTTRLIWRPKMATTGAGDDDTTTVDPPEHASTDTAVAEYPQGYPHDWAADVLG